MLPQDDVQLEIDPDQELEQEAEETAQRVMQGGELGIHRMADTDVHVQRIPEDKVFEALALFDSEDADSGHRETHNQHQKTFLHGVAQDVIEKDDKQKGLDTKQDLKSSGNDVHKRWASEADIKGDIEELQTQIDADLEDVALTEDQRLRLYGQAETDRWDNASWTLTKSILSMTGVSWALELANQSSDMASDATTAGTATSQAAGKDVDQMATQAIAKARNGEIGWGMIKEIWMQADGTLVERAEQIEQEIREGEWLQDDSQGVGSSGEVKE